MSDVDDIITKETAGVVLFVAGKGRFHVGLQLAPGELTLAASPEAMLKQNCMHLVQTLLEYLKGTPTTDWKDLVEWSKQSPSSSEPSAAQAPSSEPTSTVATGGSD